MPELFEHPVVFLSVETPRREPTDIIFVDPSDGSPETFMAWNVIPRVCPGTSCWVAQLSQHEADGGELEEGERLVIEAFPILGEPSASAQPGEGLFHDLSFGQDDERRGLITAPDDLDIQALEDFAHGLLEHRPLPPSA